MSETKSKVISLDYNLFEDSPEGDLIESTKGKQPLVFLSGVGQMIPDFEDIVAKLAKGDSFSFAIDAEKAYGVRTTEAIMDLPMDIFLQDGKLAEGVAVGNVLPLQDQHGHVHPSTVLEINEEDKTVKVDGNHPLAGQDLHFTGSVIDVRDATEEELEHGHVHGPGGHHH